MYSLHCIFCGRGLLQSDLIRCYQKFVIDCSPVIQYPPPTILWMRKMPGLSNKGLVLGIVL